MTSSVSAPIVTVRLPAWLAPKVALASVLSNTTVSEPAPPSSKSLPGPPLTISLPASANTVSSPARALITSAPSVPKIVSGPAVAGVTTAGAISLVGLDSTTSGSPAPSRKVPITRSLSPSRACATVGTKLWPNTSLPVAGSVTGCQSPAPGVASNCHAKVKVFNAGTPLVSATVPC